MQSRLDLFIVSEQLQYLNIKFKVLPGLLSDHSLIQLILTQKNIGHEAKVSVNLMWNS